MEFFVLRRGNKLGPFQAENAREMSRAGELKVGDLVFYDGADGWVPLPGFLQAVADAEKAAEQGESASETPDSPQIMLSKESEELPGQQEFGGESGTRTLSREEREVSEGGRFVQYQYCWSFLFVTFRRKSRYVLLASGDDGFWSALKFSVPTALFGWWGIPFGPFWTIGALRHNARGGVDVTLDALTTRVGRARAASACARHSDGAAPGPLQRSLGLMMATLSIALFLGIGWGAANFARDNIDPKVSGPGAAEFEKANGQLTEAAENTMYGNNAKAIELAYSFSTAFKEYFEKEMLARVVGKENATNEVFFSTFCELHLDRCVFLVRVPHLKKMNTREKEKLGDNAWKLAQKAATDSNAGFSGLRLALGIRGYSPVMDQVVMGDYVRDFSKKETGIKSRSFRAGSKLKLFPQFRPDETPEP